jgi:putative ABC transport system permease protein
MGSGVGNLIYDLRHGLRWAWKRRGFSALVILILAFGTGINTAIFSLVDLLLLRPLAYEAPDRLAMIWGTRQGNPGLKNPISFPDFQDYRNQCQTCEQIAASTDEPFTLMQEGAPERVEGALVSSNYLAALGCRPFVGRFFNSENESSTTERVVVISHGLWERQFGADRGLINQTITLNGASFTVIGVTPPSFKAINPAHELWVPMAFDGGDPLRTPSIGDAKIFSLRQRRFLTVFARRKADRTEAEMVQEMVLIAQRLEAQYPATNQGVGVQLRSFAEEFLGNVRQMLLALMGAVALLLMIACTNVANLLLVRATERKHEIAVRLALGASRARLMQQLLTESLCFSFLGAGLGFTLGFGGMKLFLKLYGARLPRHADLQLDWRIALFSLAVAVGTGLLFSLAPALMVSRLNPQDQLQETPRGSSGRANRSARTALVVVEVAIAQVLLIAMGLIVSSLWALQKVDPGFDPAGRWSFQLALPTSTYADAAKTRAFYDRAILRLQHIAGVTRVGAVTTLPLSDSNISFRFSIDGRPAASPNEHLSANFRAASADYFSAMGIPLIEGRFFNEADGPNAPPVVVINQTFARRYWPDEDPLGRRLTIPSAGNVSREIVGVVRDVRHAALDTESGAEMYVPYRQHPLPFMGIVMQTELASASLIPEVKQALQEIDPMLPIYDVQPMEGRLDESLRQPRLAAALFATLGALALILASSGIFGVITYSVAQRTREFGIRLALGASPLRILGLVLRQGLLFTAAGVGLGICCGLIFSPFLKSLLFGISGTDLKVFVASTAMLFLAAVMAACLPGVRALRIDPIKAMRMD